MDVVGWIHTVRTNTISTHLLEVNRNADILGSDVREEGLILKVPLKGKGRPQGAPILREGDGSRGALEILEGGKREGTVP